MKIVSDVRIFIDTNILFYANDPEAAFGAQSLLRLNDLAAHNNQLCISSQILREYANATLRHAIYQKLDLSESITAVRHNISQFQRDFIVFYDDKETLDFWFILMENLKSSKDVFDLNIAATLQRHNISHLLTHNVSDFSSFKSWLTVLPLFE